MKNILLYPFSEEAMPIMRHLQIIENLNIKAIVTPSGFGLAHLEMKEIDGGEEMLKFVEISTDFEKVSEQCDTILFLPFSHPIEPMANILKEKVNFAFERNKNIIWGIPNTKQILNEYEKRFLEKGLEFINYSDNDIAIQVENNILKEIDVPIIAIMGEGENTDKFEIQMALREYFLEQGYSISQIGSRNYCELLGFHSIPTFMKKGISSENKILKFNKYVSDIVKAENPDLIIIGIPGGIIPLNSTISNKYGITAFEISQSIKIDYAILSLFNQKIIKTDLEKYNNIFKYRFNTSLDTFNISNHLFDNGGSFISGYLKYINVDYKYYYSTIESNKRECGEYNFTNILTKKSIDKLGESIIESLS